MNSKLKKLLAVSMSMLSIYSVSPISIFAEVGSAKLVSSKLDTKQTKKSVFTSLAYNSLLAMKILMLSICLLSLKSGSAESSKPTAEQSIKSASEKPKLDSKLDPYSLLIVTVT